MNENSGVWCPCSHMIFDKNGYHMCELMPSNGVVVVTVRRGKKQIRRNLSKEVVGSHCVCAALNGVVNDLFPSVMMEFDFKHGTSVSTSNFPDMKRECEKEWLRQRIHCPKGYSKEQIDEKMKAFRILHEANGE